MTLKFDIRDLPDRLEYRVTQNHTRTHLMLCTLAWTTAIALALTFGGQSVLLALFLSGIFLYCAVADIQKAKRGTDMILTITQRDIISDGYTQDEYNPLNRGRIQAGISWQDSHSTEDGPAFPRGLYCGCDCILPLISMEDGPRIVEQVYTRFPDTASESRFTGSPASSPIITLCL